MAAKWFNSLDTNSTENRFWKKILAFKKKTKYQRPSVVKIWFLQVAGTDA